MLDLSVALFSTTQTFSYYFEMIIPYIIKPVGGIKKPPEN